jgi:uncharacterized protein (DUF58 family)
MLSAEIIAKIKTLDLRARHAATDLMAGEYASRFHGRGMEFHEVREYVPGDDVRGIDWNVTARMSQPFIKVFREERELTIMLVIDVSASLESGARRPRRETVAELASILAWLALRGQDRVGLLLFSAGVEHFVPPRKGRGHVMRVIGDILTWSPRERSTNLAAPLEHLSKTMRRKSVCFFVSDFLAPIPSGLLRQTARRHDLTCVRVGPAPEDALCDGGVLMIRDREAGIVREIDTSTRGYRRDVEARILNDAKKFRDVMDQAGAGVLRLDERQDIVDQVAAYLRAGTRGRAR